MKGTAILVLGRGMVFITQVILSVVKITVFWDSLVQNTARNLRGARKGFGNLTADFVGYLTSCLVPSIFYTGNQVP